MLQQLVNHIHYNITLCLCAGAQTRIRTADAAQTAHKMVGGVTLVGGTGSELARLPGGAELNILPPNGVFRSVKAQPLTVQGGNATQYKDSSVV